MSFLGDIESFSQTNLKKVDTQVTTAAGKRLVETRSDGSFSQKTVEGKSMGFVCDTKPDFQVLEVRPGVLLGSQDVAANLELLQKHHVTHILNVATGIVNFFPNQFIYKTVEILDVPETDITGYFAECFQFIDAAKATGKVLVHCNAGVSRSPSVVIAYLMSTEGVSLGAILDELRGERPAVRPNDGFMKCLEEYERRLKDKK
ncbi:dual specificity protein phosphatase 19-like [Asterias amurensis]|uniref:dual specificity protein phosphatase 19-like n=1 Tax=Asterias amurensis TaxID=7602 RepID=UPI003AB80D14